MKIFITDEVTAQETLWETNFGILDSDGKVIKPTAVISLRTSSLNWQAAKEPKDIEKAKPLDNPNNIQMLSIWMDDIPYECETAPKLSHADLIINWKEYLEEDILLIHCTAGASRSTAAGLLVMATFYDGWSASELFEELFRIRSMAIPNSLLTKYGAEILERPDIMVEYEKRKPEMAMRFANRFNDISYGKHWIIGGGSKLLDKEVK